MNVQPDMAFRLASAHTQQLLAQAARQRAGRLVRLVGRDCSTVKLDHRRGAPAGRERPRATAAPAV
jgi:hypothetical protein